MTPCTERSTQTHPQVHKGYLPIPDEYIHPLPRPFIHSSTEPLPMTNFVTHPINSSPNLQPYLRSGTDPDRLLQFFFSDQLTLLLLLLAQLVLFLFFRFFALHWKGSTPTIRCPREAPVRFSISIVGVSIHWRDGGGRHSGEADSRVRKGQRAARQRCHKPDQREFSKVAVRTGLGFVVMGFIGFFVKLIFIPINNIIVGAV